MNNPRTLHTGSRQPSLHAGTDHEWQANKIYTQAVNKLTNLHIGIQQANKIYMQAVNNPIHLFIYLFIYYTQEVKKNNKFTHRNLTSQQFCENRLSELLIYKPD